MWDDGTIWDGVRRHELLLRSCVQCGQVCHPPLPMCPNCQSVEWESSAATGQASLQSWFISTRPDRQGEELRIVIVVRLEEGVSFVANLVGAAIDTLHEGMPLELCFDEVDGVTLPLFGPKGAA